MQVYEEVWCEIKGFPSYAVSSHGRVKRLKDGAKNSPVKAGMIIAQPIRSHGYKCVTLQNGKTVKQFTVHRLVAIHFLENASNRPYVAHNDGDKLNNHVGNLRWATAQENRADFKRHGIEIFGERNGQSRLEESQVIEILNSNDTQKTMAAKYGVDQSVISDIKTGASWNHLTGVK